VVAETIQPRTFDTISFSEGANSVEGKEDFPLVRGRREKHFPDS
jgi:hypothetical protein